METNSTNTVKTTETVFTIIQGLKELETAGVTELAENLDFPKSTVHKHLHTLEQLGYVTKESNNQYRLSLRFTEIGSHIRSQRQLFEQAKSQLRKLAEKTGEIAILATEENNQSVILLRRDSDTSVSADLYPGLRIPLHSCSTGKVLLANKPEDELREYIEETGLPKLTDKTLTSREELLRELDEIRENGYAINDEERLEGTRSVAVPIEHNGTTIRSISVYGPLSRMPKERIESELPETLREVANIIRVNYSYSYGDAVHQ